MKKTIVIINFILYTINIILITTITMLTLINAPYTQKDADRVVDIYLGKTKANIIDKIRLDMDNNHRITLYDSYKIVESVNE